MPDPHDDLTSAGYGNRKQDDPEEFDPSQPSQGGGGFGDAASGDPVEAVERGEPEPASDEVQADPAD